MTETEDFERIRSLVDAILPFNDLDWNLLTPETVWHERIRRATRYCRIMERVKE